MEVLHSSKRTKSIIGLKQTRQPVTVPETLESAKIAGRALVRAKEWAKVWVKAWAVEQE